MADRLDLGVPNDLRGLKGWLLWKKGPASPSGKFDKIPFYASGGKRFGPQGSPEDRQKLVTFDAALARLREGGYDGVGLAMLGWGIVGLDFDGCRDPITGVIAQGVLDLCRATYNEISPSGTGLRAFFLGSFPDRKNHAEHVEVFCRKGFLTVTGARLNGCDLAELPKAVADEIDRRLGPDRVRSDSAAVLSKACAQDPALARLNEYGMVLRDMGSGKYDIRCPFEESHTTPGGTGASVYFAAHTGGFAHGNFDCKHSHCAERTQAEFRKAIGLGARDADDEDPPIESYTEDAERAGGPAGRSYPAIIPPLTAMRIGPAEFNTAKLTPQCVVESYLYADVAAFPAPGGTGKTTLFLFEAAHIVLGEPLYGLDVLTPGAVLLITAEDRREMLIARLRRVMEALGLGDEKQARVCAGVMIWDVTGTVCRLSELDRQGNVVLTGLADAIVDRFRDAPPVVVGLDPVISFGAGERIVNDNEHSLILAARRIVRGLGCCVRLICHTGKEVARSGSTDQYAPRGGSALADGARMVTVLRAWGADTEPTDRLTPPIGFALGSDEVGMVLVRAKCSYTPPQPQIWLKRRAYAFEHFIAMRPDPAAEARARADQVNRYLIDQLASGSYHTKKTLEDTGIMPQAKLRAALATLIASSRVISAPLPEDLRHGGRQEYLHPVATSSGNEAGGGEVGRKSASTSSSPEASSTSSLPYREKIGNEVDRTNFSQPAYPFVNEGQRGANEVDEVDEGTSAETP
ncbi:MAG: AAA family ATPase, partial [Gammaproteobacteria bacterium]